MTAGHLVPDLSDVSQSSLMGLVVAQRWEQQRYTEPTNFQLVTVARLIDKAVRDYVSAHEAFVEHDTMWDDVGPAVRPQSARGITVPLFRALGRMEDVIAALDRILRILSALKSSSELAQLAGLPLPPPSAATAVRNVRNRIAHGDEDIAAGKSGTVATLRPDPTGVEIQGHRLEFADLAQWLREIHGYLCAAIP